MKYLIAVVKFIILVVLGMVTVYFLSLAVLDSIEAEDRRLAAIEHTPRAQWINNHIGQARTYELKDDSGNRLLLYCFEKDNTIHYSVVLNHQAVEAGTAVVEDGYLSFSGTSLPMSELFTAEEITVRAGGRDGVIYVNKPEAPGFKFECRGY